MKKNLIWLFSVISILIFAVLVFWFSNNSKSIKTEKDSDWRNYKDEKYGFTFKAPKEWNVKRQKDPKLIIVEDPNAEKQNDSQESDFDKYEGMEKLSISVTQNRKEQESFKGLCYEQDSEICDKADQGTIDFSAGKGFVYLAPRAPGERRFIILANERLTFSINNDIRESKENVETINGIINSIKVDPNWRDVDAFDGIRESLNGKYEFNGTDTDNWKTYKNKEADFEIKIPENWICRESFLKKEEKYKHASQGIRCANKEDADYIYKRDGEVKKNESQREYSRMSFLIKPDFYHALTAMPSRSIAPGDKNMYSSITGIKNKSKEEVILKSFDNNENEGIIVAEGDDRIVHMNWRGQTVFISYYRGKHDDNAFDSILESFNNTK